LTSEVVLQLILVLVQPGDGVKNFISVNKAGLRQVVQFGA